MKYKVNGKVVEATCLQDAIIASKTVDLQFLIDDEIEAINGYRAIIAKTTDERLLALLSHILIEETEHLEELRNAKVGKFEILDSVKDAPDMDTPSGKKQYWLQIAMSALDDIPTNKWNMSGNKINLDNNRITLMITEDGIIWKNYPESHRDMRFTNKAALNNALHEHQL